VKAFNNLTLYISLHIGSIEMVAEPVVTPPGPWHSRLKTICEVMFEIVRFPESPVANTVLPGCLTTHDVAPDDHHESWEEAPGRTKLGSASIETSGASTGGGASWSPPKVSSVTLFLGGVGGSVVGRMPVSFTKTVVMHCLSPVALMARSVWTRVPS
jgi:hypothetical protein